MDATITILADYRVRQMRVLFPLAGPRLAAALVAEACAFWQAPLRVAASAIDGYAEAHKAVLRVLP